jgi:large subunit ribosomal protein L54
MRLNW